MSLSHNLRPGNHQSVYFKVEIAYHQPFMMIIHELLSTEDTDYLVDWATPRLSRTRQINLAEDDGERPKNEWRTRKTVSCPGL